MMSRMFERYDDVRMLTTILAATVVALVAALFFAFPDEAQAQEEEEAQETPQAEPQTRVTVTRVTVEPGDSLWSIAQERLDPNAAPDEIGNEVGRIFELNRDRMGGDPNVIVLGQDLLMPPLTSEPVEPERAYPKPAEPEASGPAEPEPEEPEPAEPERAYPEQINELSALPGLPELPAGEAVSTVKSVVSPESQYPQYDGRRLLGTVIFVLSIGLGILTAFLVALNLLPNLRHVFARPLAGLLTRRSVRETERNYSWNYVLTGGPDDHAEPAREFGDPRWSFEEQNRQPTAAEEEEEEEKQESPRELLQPETAARPPWGLPLRALSAPKPDPERPEDDEDAPLEDKRSFQVVSIPGPHRERSEDGPPEDKKRALGESR